MSRQCDSCVYMRVRACVCAVVQCAVACLLKRVSARTACSSSSLCFNAQQCQGVLIRSGRPSPSSPTHWAWRRRRGWGLVGLFHRLLRGFANRPEQLVGAVGACPQLEDGPPVHVVVHLDCHAHHGCLDIDAVIVARWHEPKQLGLVGLVAVPDMQPR